MLTITGRVQEDPTGHQLHELFVTGKTTEQAQKRQSKKIMTDFTGHRKRIKYGWVR